MNPLFPILAPAIMGIFFVGFAIFYIIFELCCKASHPQPEPENEQGDQAQGAQGQQGQGEGDQPPGGNALVAICPTCGALLPPPDEPHVDEPQPNVPQPDVPQPNVPQADVPQPNVPQADVPQPNVPQADVPQADQPKMIFSKATISFNVVGALFPALLVIIASDKVRGVLYRKWNSVKATFIVEGVFVGFDCFLLLVIYTCKDSIINHSKKLHHGWIRDLIDIGVHVLGLYLQLIYDPSCGWRCFWVLLSFIWIFWSFMIIMKPMTALGFADMYLSLLSVVLIHLVKTKPKNYADEVGRICAMALASFLSVMTILWRNHHEEVNAGKQNPKTVYGWVTTVAMPAIGNCWVHFFGGPPPPPPPPNDGADAADIVLNLN